MDAKITKQRMRQHLEYDWTKYILILVISVAFWLLIYPLFGNVTKADRLEFVCYFTPEMNSEMRDKVNGERTRAFGDDTSVKEISFITVGDSSTASMIDFYVPTMDYTIMMPSTLEKSSWVMSDYFFTFDEIIQAGYWQDRDGQEMIDALESCGALYRWHLSDEVLDQYETEEQKEAIRKRAEPYEGKVIGILLNQLPRVTKGVFFEFEELTSDAEGNPVAAHRQEYVLTLNKLSLSKTSSGANKGSFNAQKEDPQRTETFDYLTYLIKEDGDNAGRRNVERYYIA